MVKPFKDRENQEGGDPFVGNIWVLEGKPAEDPTNAGEAVEQRLKKLGWPDDETARIKIAVDEAVANAILHGNEKSDDKTVTLEVTASEDAIAITVKDHGNFKVDPEKIPDATSEERLLVPNGRGIRIMREYCDEVVFGNGSVTLKKKRSPHGHS